MLRATCDDAEHHFAELVDRAARDHERVLISREGQDVAAVISTQDLQRLEALERDAEDRADIADAIAALQEAQHGGLKSVDELIAELGLQL